MTIVTLIGLALAGPVGAGCLRRELRGADDAGPPIVRSARGETSCVGASQARSTR